MYTYRYPRPMVTVDIVLFQRAPEEHRVLLIQRAGQPYRGRFALPGGFLDIKETLKEAAERELAEETGLKDIQLEQIHTFSAVDRDPRGRVISTAYGAVLNPAREYAAVSGSDAGAVGWFSLTELPELAFDHGIIIRTAQDQLLNPPPDLRD